MCNSVQLAREITVITSPNQYTVKWHSLSPLSYHKYLNSVPVVLYNIAPFTGRRETQAGLVQIKI